MYITENTSCGRQSTLSEDDDAEDDESFWKFACKLHSFLVLLLFNCTYIWFQSVPGVGGGGDDDSGDSKEEQAEQERLRQEAIKQTEKERREKYKKQEDEREVVRQSIRDKVIIIMISLY